MNGNLPRNDNNENKSRAKTFWKHVGFIGVALLLAIVTVFVLNLNVNV